MRGVPWVAVVYFPLRGPGVGELVALRPALACLSSCSRKTSVVCAQCRRINTHEILAALPSCTRYACNEHANLCTFVTVRDRRTCEHGRQRAPVQPGLIKAQGSRISKQPGIDGRHGARAAYDRA